MRRLNWIRWLIAIYAIFGISHHTEEPPDDIHEEAYRADAAPHAVAVFVPPVTRPVDPWLYHHIRRHVAPPVRRKPRRIPIELLAA